MADVGSRDCVRKPGRLCCFLALMTLATPGYASGQWVEAPGKGWVSVMVFHHDTRTRYDELAEVNSLFWEGHATSTAAFATAAMGVIPNWDVWARLSWNDLEFTDLSDPGGLREIGLGDINVWLRVAPLKYMGIDTPFAIRGGVKLPIGDSPVDAEIIPLGEGQTDWEIMAEWGHSFWPRSYYVNGWLGYRWRSLNEEAARDPGEEIFFLAQAAGSVGRFGYKLIAEGFNGGAPTLLGLRVRTARRKYAQLTPTASWSTSHGTVEVAYRVPLLGRNQPAGGALVVGFFTNFAIGG